MRSTKFSETDCKKLSRMMTKKISRFASLVVPIEDRPADAGSCGNYIICSLFYCENGKYNYRIYRIKVKREAHRAEQKESFRWQFGAVHGS